METTWDGNWYHKNAVGLLKNGWNPTRESARDFYISNRNPIKISHEKSQKLIYENHYAKGAWIFASNIYKLTGNIETGHSINLIIMVATFCLLVFLLLCKISIIPSILISAITVFNPISAPQLFLFYNDGLLGLLVVDAIIALILIVSQRNKIYSTIGLTIFFITTTILANIKFTGLVFLFLFSLTFFVYMIITPKLRKTIAKKMLLVGFCSVLFSVAIVGFSPYISNINNGFHPLHPLAGKDKIDIMTGNSPKEFANHNKLLIPLPFVKSIFSKLDNFSYSSDKKTELKIPFTISESELINLKTVDARISGNGIFFSGLFLISIVVIFIWLIKGYKAKSIDFKISICIIVPLILIVFIFKEMWWARYFPFIYITVSLAMYILWQSKKEFSKMLFYGLFFVGFINSYLLFAPNFESGIKMARLSSCGDILNHRTVFYKTSHKIFYGTFFNVLDCRGNVSSEINFLPAKKEANIQNYQSTIVVPGYMEVFYEKK